MQSRFEKWCAYNGSIALPASPSIVAAFIADHGGLDASTLWAEIAALDEKHEELGYAPPGRSTVAIAAFNQVHHVDPPRAWSKDEKHFFAVLPWAVQMVLARREADRDRALNKAQNEAANKRKANGVFIKPKQPQPAPPKQPEKTIQQRIEELCAECDRILDAEAERIKREDAPSVPLSVIRVGLARIHRGDSILAVEAIEKAK